GRLLFDFNTEFDAPTPSAQDLASRFHMMLERQDVLVLLAEDSSADNPRAMGFAYLTLRPTPYGDGPVAELVELYVRPELRNHGIGSRKADFHASPSKTAACAAAEASHV
ncbi:MAG: GNAT family N-acetyltransferase, partial [Peptidiphaga sp.]